MYLSKILLFLFSPIMDYTEFLLTLLLLTSYLSNSRVLVLLMILTHETWICCIVGLFDEKELSDDNRTREIICYLQLSLVQYSVSWCNRPHDIPENGLLCHIWPNARKKNLKPTMHGLKNYDGCHHLCSISLIICEKENKD